MLEQIENGVEKEDLDVVLGEDVRNHSEVSHNSKESSDADDSSEMSSVESKTIVKSRVYSELQSEMIEDEKEGKSDNKVQKSNKSNQQPVAEPNKKTIERKLIMQRNLEDKKSEDKEDKNKKEKQKEKDDDEDKEEHIPDDVINFVDTFKRNSIFLLRNTGIYQGFESILNGIKFNIHKIDGFLEYAVEMFDLDMTLITNSIKSDIKFGDGEHRWTEDQLKSMIHGFYD